MDKYLRDPKVLTLGKFTHHGFDFPIAGYMDPFLNQSPQPTYSSTLQNSGATYN